MFVKRLETLLRERNLTIAELSLIVKIPSSTMYSWQNGVHPTAEKLSKLADFFEVSTDYLLGRENEVGIIELKNGLTKIENDLITMFRKLDHDGQNKLFHIVQAYVSV